MTKNGKRILKYFEKGLLKMNRPSDDEFDELLERSLHRVKPISQNRLSLDAKDAITKTVWLSGPPAIDKLEGTELKVTTGKDNIVRYIPIGVTIYFFSKHSIMAYQCSFDPTTEVAMHENTYEFFYNDIVSFETKSESGAGIEVTKTEKVIKKFFGSWIKVGKKFQYDKRMQFILTTSGGNQLPVDLTHNTITQQAEGGKYELDKAKRSVDVVRRTIRDHKSYILSKL